MEELKKEAADAIYAYFSVQTNANGFRTGRFGNNIMFGNNARRAIITMESDSDGWHSNVTLEGSNPITNNRTIPLDQAQLLAIYTDAMTILEAYMGSPADPWTAIARLTSAVEQLSTYKK